jgi:aryl-alcohol dehydrogenase-like predicted oxidoreductase
MAMETRTLGSDGPSVSVVGLGCNNFGMRIDADQSAAVVHAALDAGITHFDTAEMYGGGSSEVFLGQALGQRRDEVTIATKFLPRSNDEPYEPGALRRRVLEGCEISLERLGTDRIDVYYQHYPDADAPEDEALEALTELVAAGKVLHAACSNFSAAQLGTSARLAGERTLTPFVASQIEWSLLNRAAEADVIPASRAAGIGIVPYFPLASGLLTGKYTRGQAFPAGTRFAELSFFANVATDENFAYVDELSAFAEARGHSILELAIAWLAAQDGVGSVIAGATTEEQVRANAQAGSWHLSAEELASLPQPPA